MSAQLLENLAKQEGVHIKGDVLQAPWKGIAKYVAGFLTKQLIFLPQKIKQYNADIVLFSSMVTASLSYPLNKKIDVPMVAITHGHDVIMPFKPYQWYVPKIFQSLSGVISVSEATQKACLRRGLSPQKSTVIGNGCSIEFARQLPDLADANRFISNKLNVDPQKYTLLLTVGRHIERKGHQWFIEQVFPKLSDHFLYVSIGGGPLVSHLLKVKNKLDDTVAKRIHLLGSQPDDLLYHFYRSSDLFVMPNIPVKGDMEGFGIVILEANLAGTPVVASDLDGISNVIHNNINGFLVEPLDAHAYVDILNKLSQKDIADLKKSCFTYALKTHNWRKIAKSYVDYLANKII